MRNPSFKQGNQCRLKSPIKSGPMTLPVALGFDLLVFQHLISSYLVEVCGGCDLQLHACLFSVHAYSLEDELPPRYASPEETATAYKDMVQAANGRFHWFGETGVCAVLVESLRRKSGNLSRHQLSTSTVDDLSSLKKEEKKTRPSKVPFPKPTTLTLARMGFREQHQDGERIGCPKALLWRPSSGKAEIPPDLPTVVFGPGSVHRKERVESLHKKVSAKYCDIFPSVEMQVSPLLWCF
ncbi:von Willebrand factor A domain-containing protein 3A, partial [Ophiophagus hannah]